MIQAIEKLNCILNSFIPKRPLMVTRPIHVRMSVTRCKSRIAERKVMSIQKIFRAANLEKAGTLFIFCFLPYKHQQIVLRFYNAFFPQ